MTQKSIHIIGAGIARLSAICYEQMNGYQAQIFELHDRPGGMVTAWTRHGYRVDGCIEFLNGSRSGTRFHSSFLREAFTHIQPAWDGISNPSYPAPATGFPVAILCFLFGKKVQ